MELPLGHYRVGVDIGGTFTDLIVLDDATGSFAVGKALTTPHDPTQAVETVLIETLERADIDVGDVQLDVSPWQPPQADLALATGPAAGANPAGPNASGAALPFLPDGMTLEQYEDEIIREAVRRAGGNKSQAARLLGLSRNALRYRLSKMGVPDESE